MENKNDFFALYTEDRINHIKSRLNTFENAKKTLDTQRENEESECKHNYSIPKNKRNNLLHLIQAKYKRKRHDSFVDNCLDPKGYERGDGEVYACVIGSEIINEERHISISIVTPSMAYIDNRYFVSKKPDEDNIWWEDYRPYYYEFTAILTKKEATLFQKQLEELKSDRKDHDNETFWFKAKLAKKSKDNIISYVGILNFGGSKAFAKKLYINSLEAIDPQILKKLNDTYTISNYVSKYITTKYLDNMFKTTSKYKVRVLNVGQANCIFIINQKTNDKIFFDVGRPNPGFCVAKKWYPNRDLKPNTNVKKNLAYLHNLTPKYIIVSHWHLDHFAAFNLLNDYGRDCTWILPSIENDKDIKSANRLFKYLADNGVNIQYINTTPSDGKIYDNNNGIQIIRCTGQNKGNPNARSLMLRIKDTVFAADCLYEYWPKALKNNLSNVKRLIVPHHCSKQNVKKSGLSESNKIINSFTLVNGKEAYICVGYNKYNHPDGTHKKALKKAGFTVYETRKIAKYYEFDIT